MMHNIIFHGELAEFIGHKSLEAKVSTVAETMRFLICNFPKVEAHMAQRYYKIIIGKSEIEESALSDGELSHKYCSCYKWCWWKYG